jgi:hypothetical protein
MSAWSLVPIDDQATWRRRDTNATFCLAAQPLERTFIVPKKALECFKACIIVITQPFLLLLAKHVLLHHARLDWHAGQAFEAKPTVLRIGVLGAHCTYNEDRFYADTKFIGLVCSASGDKPGVKEDMTYNNQVRW